jgi:hypothetical protein
MSIQDDWIKFCEKCNAMIPIKDIQCEYCGHVESQFEFSSEDLQITINELTTAINDAFYRLERFMGGFLADYQSFDFIFHFELLFVKGKMIENDTYQTSKRINQYWMLIQQILYDWDKGNYSNRTANENEFFIEDCEDLSYITHRRLHKFLEFASQDDIDELNKKISIVDIIKDADSSSSPPSKTVPASDLRLQFSSIEVIEKLFENLKPYFGKSAADLKKVLLGQNLDEPIVFSLGQNRFVEIFKRLKYNGFLLSTSTEIKNWICKNFLFTHVKGEIREVRPFKESSVWDILTKEQYEPSKKSRILNLEWLPHKSPGTLRRQNSN